MGFFVLALTFELGNMPNYWACMSCQVLLASAAFDTYFDNKEKSFWLDQNQARISRQLLSNDFLSTCEGKTRLGTRRF